MVEDEINVPIALSAFRDKNTTDKFVFHYILLAQMCIQ